MKNLFNIEIEMQVLGAILLDNNKILDVMEVINENDFYKSTHKEIYKEMLNLFNSKMDIDTAVLLDRLKEKQITFTEVSNIVSSTSTTQFINTHVKIINEKSILRQYRLLSNSILQDIESSDDIDAIKEKIENKLLNINNKTDNDDGDINKGFENWLSKLEKRVVSGDGISGIKSGLAIDKIVQGFQEGGMYVIGARPAMGKSAFVLNIFMRACITENKKVNLYSLEMSKNEIFDRISSNLCLIDMKKIKSGELNDEELCKIVQSQCKLMNGNMKIFDEKFKLENIISSCKKRKIQDGLDMIVIDYMQLVENTVSKNNFNREQELSKISRRLKLLAKELRCPVIVLAQLSRACEQRANHRPMLSDLRESGAIEQDADLVMFLYRDEVYDAETDEKDMMEIIVAKNRQGVTGTVKQAFIGKYQRIGNLQKIGE